MVKFTYYGHAAFLLDDGKHKLLFDPFITGNPSAKINVKDIAADYIFVTHAHGDHMGDAPEIAKETGAEVIAIPEILSIFETVAPDSVQHPMNIGGSLTLPFGKVRMVFAQHSCGIPGGIACGFVVYVGGLVIYYAGDTALFSDMKLIGQKDALDWALLPIGDNYTMGLEDAALAAQMLNVRHVIPLHYDTWPIIQQNAAQYKKLTESTSRAAVHIVKSGESLQMELVDAEV